MSGSSAWTPGPLERPIDPDRQRLPFRQRPGAAQSIGVWVFIGVATALFSLFIAAYVMRMSEFDATRIAMPWQLVLSTSWLIAGSVMLQRASKLASQSAEFEWQLMAGGACALAFIVVQLWAWQDLLDRQVTLQGGPAGSFFYLLTTMHALHVAGGLGGWCVAWLVSRQRPLDSVDVAWRIALCARYWHFLLLVWVVLYAAFVFVTPEFAAFVCGSRRR